MTYQAGDPFTSRTIQRRSSPVEQLYPVKSSRCSLEVVPRQASRLPSARLHHPPRADRQDTTGTVGSSTSLTQSAHIFSVLS